MIDLLKKWLNGTARSTDEQKLDAAARSDEFLADALEGYRSVPEGDHAANIAQLKRQLREKGNRRRTAIVWWRIAAAAALVGVVSTWIFVSQTTHPTGIAAKEETSERMSESVTDDEATAPITPAAPPAEPAPVEMVQEAEVAIAESQSGSANPPQVGLTRELKINKQEEVSSSGANQTLSFEADTYEVEDLSEVVVAQEMPEDTFLAEDLAAATVIADKVDTVISENKSMVYEGESEAELRISSVEIQKDKALQGAPAAAPNRADSKSKKRTKTSRASNSINPTSAKELSPFVALHGTIYEAVSEEPLIGVSISIKGTNEGAMTDFDGNFELRSDQPLPWVLELSYTGYSSQEVKVENVDEALVIEMEESGALLDEVVVTGFSQRPAVKNVEPKPKGGWKKFNRYIRDNLQYPPMAKDQQLEGTVELEFYINQEGRPEQITVLDALCAPCNDEAIRLLREGPKWRGKEKWARVSIPFEL